MNPGEADPDGDQELPQLIGQALMDACRHRRVHDRPEDAADRVDQRSFPGKHPPQPLRRPDETQQRRYYRRPGHHQDGARHQRRPRGHSQQQRREHRRERPGDRDSPGDQPDHHAAGVPAQLAELQPEPGVVKDDGHRQRHQRLECRPEQLVRVNIAGDRACVKPAGNKMISAGIRRRLAST